MRSATAHEQPEGTAHGGEGSDDERAALRGSGPVMHEKAPKLPLVAKMPRSMVPASDSMRTMQAHA